MRKLSGLYCADDDGSLDDAADANLYEPGALLSRRHPPFRLRSRLPPVDMARRLFAAQYMYMGTIFAFTDPGDSFERLLAGAYRGGDGAPDPRDRDGCLAHAKVLLVLAFGQLYSVNQWVGFRGPPGFDYFTDALGLLPESHEAGSMLCVETLALAGYFMQNMNRRDAAFQYVGRALRMAISLGLHQEVGPGDGTEAGVDEAAAREHRRRVWWSVYSLDRILCVKSGNPIMVQDDDIGVHQPSPLAGEADPDNCPAVVLRHYTQLSRILGRIHTAIYRRAAPRSGRSLMASVQSIILALSRWHRELPDRLRFEPSRPTCESISALAHYFYCINMTARPLFFHIVQRRLGAIRAAGPDERDRDWKDGLSHSTVRVIDMCIGAAQDTVTMMVIASQRDMVGERSASPPVLGGLADAVAATYGYIDGENIFSATIVLVMVCAAFPAASANSTAMNAGLGLLRSMGERGNSHMGARHELLVHLHASLLDHHDRRGPRDAHRRHQTACSLVSSRATLLSRHRQQMMNTVGPPGADGVGETPATFPAVDSSALDEPFYDEGVAAGLDFGLWEEGFACPTMDLNLDLNQRAAAAAAAQHPHGALGNVQLNDLIDHHV